MAFREKQAWIGLVTYGVVFGGYFLALSRAWEDGWDRALIIGLLIAAVIALIVITVTLHIIVAIINSREANAPADERETLIDLKAERIASYTLSVGVVCVIGALLMGWNGVLIAALLQGVLVIAEIVKSVAQIIYFRGGV